MTRPADRYRHARAATAVLFAVNGALFAGLLPRYPELKDDLGMTNTVLGLVVAAFPVGALLAGPTAAAIRSATAWPQASRSPSFPPKW